MISLFKMGQKSGALHEDFFHLWPLRLMELTKLPSTEVWNMRDQ
jgi:hypothetical protein